MNERFLDVGVRMPASDEVREARMAVEAFAGRKPKTLEEVYRPRRRSCSAKCLRRASSGQTAGDSAWANWVSLAIPNEVFAVSGLTIKRRSPLKPTFTIELANGAEGYIPHSRPARAGRLRKRGARTSCLEETAEVKIVSTELDLLDSVAEKRKDEASVVSGK